MNRRSLRKSGPYTARSSVTRILITAISGCEERYTHTIYMYIVYRYILKWLT